MEFKKDKKEDRQTDRQTETVKGEELERVAGSSYRERKKYVGDLRGGRKGSVLDRLFIPHLTETQPEEHKGRRSEGRHCQKRIRCED